MRRLRSENADLESRLRIAEQRIVTLENQLESAGLTIPRTTRFDFLLAAELAGFAFESYNEPREARWEVGADRVRVAFKSESFAKDCYQGVLRVTLLEAQDLPTSDFAENLVSLGSGFKPYVLFAVTEVGRHAMQRVLVARAHTASLLLVS